MNQRAFEAVRKMMEDWRITTNVDYEGCGLFSVIGEDGLDNLARLIAEGVPEKKEIRYEELDTGIGIDRLEYDDEGNRKAHAHNTCIETLLKNWEEWHIT